MSSVLTRGILADTTSRWRMSSRGDRLDRQASTCVSSDPVGDIFKALADPTRRLILDELRERDGQTLFELCTRLIMKHNVGSTRQAISQHLGVLEDAGLVTTRREGRYKFHHIQTAPIREVATRWTSAPEEDR
jgi:DNA-binding transcriptional ArsR family regulator